MPPKIEEVENGSQVVGKKQVPEDWDAGRSSPELVVAALRKRMKMMLEEVGWTLVEVEEAEWCREWKSWMLFLTEPMSPPDHPSRSQ